MTFKDKLILSILSILTLGIYPLIVFSKKSKKPANTFNHAEKAKFKVVGLVEALGGDDNIVGAEYTYKKVKIFIKNKAIVNLEKVSKLKGISGVMATQSSVTLVAGDQSKAIAESLKK